MSVASPAYCLNCTHFGRVRVRTGPLDDGPDDGTRITDDAVYSCTAFDQIPDGIITGETKHDRAVRGDHGIRFEADDPDGPHP